MEFAVWKFPVEVTDEFVVRMPVAAATSLYPDEAQVALVAVQDGRPFMWVLVNPDGPCVERRFCVRGTGHRVEPGLRHVGSFMLAAGAFVGHLFERPLVGL